MKLLDNNARGHGTSRFEGGDALAEGIRDPGQAAQPRNGGGEISPSRSQGPINTRLLIKNRRRRISRRERGEGLAQSHGGFPIVALGEGHPPQGRFQRRACVIGN